MREMLLLLCSGEEVPELEAVEGPMPSVLGADATRRAAGREEEAIGAATTTGATIEDSAIRLEDQLRVFWTACTPPPTQTHKALPWTPQGAGASA
jgi:hypothetical protein